MNGLANFRISQHLTQAQLAKALGLRSKGYLSVIERGEEPCPLKLALRIEDHSLGQVLALSLVDRDDAVLLRRFATRYAELPGERCTVCAPPAVGGRA